MVGSIILIKIGNIKGGLKSKLIFFVKIKFEIFMGKVRRDIL